MIRRRFALYLFLTFLVLLPGFAARAQTVTSVYGFCQQASCLSGQYPGGNLLQAPDGNIYGLATQGGAYGAGTIFSFNTSTQVLTVLYSFCAAGGNCTDGENPSGLIVGADGNLYGVSMNGGQYGNGAIWKFTPPSTLTPLYPFCEKGGSACSDGSRPLGIILGSDGNFWGVSERLGGASGNDLDGGSVWEYLNNIDGTVVNYWDFCTQSNCTDGAGPNGIVEGTDGNFYGSFYAGGTNGAGGVFKVPAGGGAISQLHAFCSGNCTDESTPVGNVAEASDGNLYGTTSGGSSAGTIYKLTTTGTLTNIYVFCSAQGDCPDGDDPQETLFIASDGNFYGSNDSEGVGGDGEFFHLNPIKGVDTPVDYYDETIGSMNALNPSAVMLQGSNGILYGVSTYGGSKLNMGLGYGTLFTVTPASALPPPVQLTLSKTSIKLGASVTLDWSVLNAFSNTMRQCYAFVQGGASGAGTWTGKQAGTYSASTQLLTGSATITPKTAGLFVYDLTCGGVESGFATLTVSNGGSVALSASNNPVYEGQNVTFTATVSETGAVPTGTVTFSADGVTLATEPLNSSGVATLSANTNGYAPATYPLIAEYNGNSSYSAVASSPLSVTLKPAVTTTTLSASPSTVTSPAAITLTATVSRPSGYRGVATGSVTFYGAGTELGVRSLNSSGVATLTESTNGVPPNTYAVFAVYNGDSADGSSESSAIPVTVK